MTAPPKPILPSSIHGRLVVIGDVHGHARLLMELLRTLRSSLGDLRERWIVFVGDLIDRGPDSRKVIDILLHLSRIHGKVACCMGNHEMVCAQALGILPYTPQPASSGADAVLGIGSGQRVRTPAQVYARGFYADNTFRSYGVAFGDLDGLRKAMPPDHTALLKGLPWCVEHPDYLFVHAGFLPGKLVEKQLAALRARDLSGPKPPWLHSNQLSRSPLPPDCRRTVVSGHVRQDDVVFADRRILVDTSGGRQGPLSAVALPEGEVFRSSPL